MLPVLDFLKTRYEAVFQADTDARFYLNLHGYFDLVEKTPELKSLVDASQHVYAEKHGSLWPRGGRLTDEQADVAEEVTYRIERFNLYALSATIYVRVYIPLESYINSLEPEIDQHPSAVLMIRGIDRINPEYGKKNPWKWGKDRLRSTNKWFVGQRTRYEGELRQFHLALLDALFFAQSEKVEHVKAPLKSEMPLNFNFRTGDFSLNELKGNFNPASQEYSVLVTLLNNSDHLAPYIDLIQAAYPHAKEVTKSNKLLLYKIVDSIRGKIGVTTVDNVPRVGYRLVFNAKNAKGKQS